MEPAKIIKGYKPLHFWGESILFSKGYRLYLSDLSCDKFEPIGEVPHSLIAALKTQLRSVSRIFRTGLYPGCVLPNNRVLLTEKNRIWQVDLKCGRIELDHEAKKGFRPLSIASIEDLPGCKQITCCYGEYGLNHAKNEVNIWGKLSSGEWIVVYTFPKGAIEHIHAVIPDKERSVTWILTGDFGNSAGLWKATNNFSTVEPVLVGKQIYRSVWLFSPGDDIFYATDSQLEKNSFRKLIFEDNSIQSGFIAPIPGSSIYSCVVGEKLVFSTTVEPGEQSGHFFRDLFETKRGPGIENNSASLLVWHPNTGLKEITALAKDFLPLRLFQFGTLSFPIGINPTRNRLYAYATALTKYDDCTIVYDLLE